MKERKAKSEKPPLKRSSRKVWLFRGLALGIPLAIGMACLAGWMIYHGRLVVDSEAMSISLKEEPIYVYDQAYQKSGHRYLFDESLGWRNVPGDRGHTFSLPAAINSHGLRGQERQYKKPAGMQRVLILGDSFAWGYAVGDDDVCLRRLENRLQQEHASVEVLNSAVSGWSTDQEYLYFQREGYKYSPDVVVVAFYVVNDFLENLESVQHGHRKPIFLDTQLTLAGSPVPKPGTESPKLRSRAHPADLAPAIIAALAEDCNQRQCKLVVAKFGNIFFPDDAELTDFSRRLQNQVSLRSDVLYFDFDSVCRTQGLTGPNLYAGNPGGHWNPQTHELFAQSLCKLLLENSLIHKQSPTGPPE